MKASEVLLGQYERTLDARGKFEIPEAFRPAFMPQCVLTLGEGTFLRLFTIDRWEEYLERMQEEIENSDEEVDHISRMMALSYITAPDRRGRITVPLELREYARLQKALVLSGNLYWVEVWNADLWKEHIALGKS